VWRSAHLWERGYGGKGGSAFPPFPLSLVSVSREQMQKNNICINYDLLYHFLRKTTINTLYMNNINNFFDSRDLFYNKHSLCDSGQAATILRQFTGERSPTQIADALLRLGSALFCYNSSIRFYTQRVVAIENSINGIIKRLTLKHTALENKELDGLIYTIFWLSGYRQLGEALTIARDLLDVPPTSKPNFETALRIFYDLTYLGVFFSPQGRSCMIVLKISKVAYFVFKEYSECSLSLNQIKNTIKKPTLANTINLLTRGVDLYGNSLQLLYTAGNAFRK
jgi:hypothetical protein